MPKRRGTYASNSRRVYKKRKTYKRRTMRRTGVMRSAIGRTPRIPTYNFSRRDANTVVTTIPMTQTSVGVAQSFQMDRVINAVEFQNLFDQYKIWKIVLEFKLQSNPYLAASNPTFPTLYVCNDHDDTSAPTLVNIKERALTRRYVMRPNSIVRWTLRPATLAESYRSAITVAYTPNFNKWLDITNMDVPHFGTKWVLDNDGVAATVDIVMKMEAKYYFSCKDVR